MQVKNKMNKIIYLDAAATYMKSDSVMGVQADFVREKYANSGRGVCARVAAVDDMVKGCRVAMAEFMNADADGIVFVSGTTDAMNRIVRIVQNTVGRWPLRVAVSDLDHHSARLPWMAAGADVVVCPLDKDLNIDASAIPVADVIVITAMSNVLGVAQDVKKIVEAARKKNPDVIAIVDAAQFVVHADIDMRAWDADFVCWSGHKIGADNGIGVMAIKNPNRFMPDKFGGGMVNVVNLDGTFTVQTAPDKFEAGTLPLVQIAGLASAVKEIKNNRPKQALIKFLYDELSQIPRVRILTQPDAVLLSFVIDGMHVIDFGALMGAYDVCLRVGNMCATWIHNKMNLSGSIRVSVGAYNTMDEMKRFVEIVKNIVK